MADFSQQIMHQAQRIRDLKMAIQRARRALNRGDPTAADRMLFEVLHAGRMSQGEARYELERKIREGS